MYKGDMSIESLFLFLLLLCNPVAAKDFGKLGHTYEIAERNILEVINERLKKVDMKKIQEEAKTKTRQYVERPREVKGVTNAEEDREYHFDPTYTLQEDIKDDKGNIIHKAGVKINPLEHVSLREDLIFIDGDNASQVKFALEYPKKAKIILIKGSPLKLQKEHKVWIYFDQDGFLTGKLGVKHIPAIVFQDKVLLKIKEVKTGE